MKNKTRKTLVVASLAVAMVASGGARAATYTFDDAGLASGSINTSTGDITLNALFANPRDVADTISGLVLTFATAPSATSLTSQAAGDGQLDTFDIDHGNHGNPDVRTMTPTAGASVNWTLSASSAVLTLSANHSCIAGGQHPCDLIVGPSPYTAFNSSIEIHSPFLDLQGLFNISGLGGEILTGIAVNFGTGTDQRIETFTCTDCPSTSRQTTPLPATLPLLASGLGALGLLGWRRKRKAQAAT